MAHQCLHRPVLSSLGLTSSRAVAWRCFSQSALRLRAARSDRPRAPPEQSQSIAMKNINIRDFPNDLGLLPSTFVPPRVPLSNPQLLWKILFQRFKSSFGDLLSRLIFRYTRTPRPKLENNKLAPAAARLYQDMYEAFARGDVNGLKKICASGLVNSFAARIHARGRDSMKWELLSTKRPKVITNRAARLPVDNAYLRQAVVRIASTQRLTRYRPDGSVVPGSGKEKELVEYVVIQKRLLMSEEDPWMVWGTIPETAAEKIEKGESF